MKLTDLKHIEQQKASQLHAFAEKVKHDLGLEEFDLRLLPSGDIRLELIMVPRRLRKAGIGSKAMELLNHYADAQGARVVLSTAGRDKRQDWGTTSENRLRKFYKRFDFVRNRGRHKDFQISDTMYRKPRTKI